MTDAERVRLVLTRKVEQHDPPASAREMRRNRDRIRKRNIERDFARVAGQELEYNAAIPAWIIWMLLSSTVKAIVRELAKRLYEKLTKENV